MEIYNNLSPELKEHINIFLKEKQTFNKVLNQLEQFNILKIQHNLNNYNFFKLLRKESIKFSPTRDFYNHLLVTGELTNIFNSKKYNCRFNRWEICPDCENLNIKYFLENRDYIYPNYRRLHTRFNDVEIFYKWINKGILQMYILAELTTEPDFSDSEDTEEDTSEDSDDGYADTNFIPYPHLNNYFRNRNNPIYNNISDSDNTEYDSEEEYADTNFIPYPHLNDYFTAAYMR